MNNPLLIAEEYKFLTKSIKTFREDIITAKAFSLVVLSPITLYSLSNLFDHLNYSGLIWGGFLFFSFITSCILVVLINAIFMEGDLELVLSKKRFYHSRFSPEEQKKLALLLEEPFNEILKKEESVIRNRLIERLGKLEHTLYKKEYLQSLKDTIEQNPENEIYLPTLKKLVKNYNFNLEHSNRKYKDINKELSKANISMFSTKKEPPMKILEQE